MKTSVSSRPAARVKRKPVSTKARKRKIKSIITTKQLDAKFDRSEDITEHLDLSSLRQPGLENRRVNVDFPAWMVDALDTEARRLGVPRQSVIKVWIADRLGK